MEGLRVEEREEGVTVMAVCSETGGESSGTAGGEEGREEGRPDVGNGAGRSREDGGVVAVDG